MSVLPTLDIAVWYENPLSFAEELRSACHKVGFFLLRHDIPHEVAQRQLDETRRFFRHSLDQKQSISYQDSPSLRGYMRLGVENTAGAIDLREQIEYAAVYAKKDRKRMWPPYERLKDHQNPWPPFQPTLQSATEEYLVHVRRIADCLREALCLALGVGTNTLDPLFGVTSQQSETIMQHPGCEEEEPPHWVLKLINYPVIQQNQNAASASFGVGGHTDTNFLTLVLQDDVGGLQVFSEGAWIDVPSNLEPGVLVCNLGEQAEILSRGYFLATPHRVLMNVSGKCDRVSVPLFYNPVLSATIEPIVPDDMPMKWERSSFEPWRRPSNALLATVGDNTFKSLARSHPEVFQMHHPDLKLLEDGSIVRRGVQK
jgi:isopenicillin N synthase-like dioxygenase